MLNIARLDESWVSHRNTVSAALVVSCVTRHNFSAESPTQAEQVRSVILQPMRNLSTACSEPAWGRSAEQPSRTHRAKYHEDTKMPLEKWQGGKNGIFQNSFEGSHGPWLEEIQILLSSKSSLEGFNLWIWSFFFDMQKATHQRKITPLMGGLVQWMSSWTYTHVDIGTTFQTWSTINKEASVIR